MKHKGAADSYYIYGLNTVALLTETEPSRIIEIKATSNLAHRFKDLNLTNVSVKELNHLFPDCNHQGVAALVKTKYLCDLETLISQSEQDRIVVLDRITDIGNIGAIIRSAMAFGINKFVIPKHDGCSDMAKIAKSSSGYSEIANICEVVNLSHALDELKQYGYWCLGLDGLAKTDITKLHDFPKLVLVLGNEHEGIRMGLRNNCDLLVRIPMHGQVESLNVAAAAAIAFFNTI